MNSKSWTVSEIRTLARETVDGRQKTIAARGAYFRALVETAQADLGGKAGQEGQLAAVRAVHKKFYPIVLEAVTTPDIAKSDKAPKPERIRRGLERNRRSNFARSAYGTIRRWLRAEGHDLMKLDPEKVTKSQLLNEAPPTRKHALTKERVNKRANKLISGLLVFTRSIAKVDQEQAASVANEAIEQLVKLLASTAKGTKDAKVAAQEQRPLHLGGTVFWPTDVRIKKAA